MNQKIIMLILALICISNAQTYNRSDWGASWIDVDKDCQNTRQEVLIQESLIPVTLDSTGCKVVSGLWLCLYTGSIVTDPSKLDIDHLVPLENANASGGSEWPKAIKKEYANVLIKPFHLVAVLSSTNRSKQSKSPDQWMPSFKPFRCTYLHEWVNVKERWNLTMTEDEKKAIQTMLSEECQ